MSRRYMPQTLPTNFSFHPQTSLSSRPGSSKNRIACMQENSSHHRRCHPLWWRLQVWMPVELEIVSVYREAPIYMTREAFEEEKKALKMAKASGEERCL